MLVWEGAEWRDTGVGGKHDSGILQMSLRMSYLLILVFFPYS